MINNKNIKSQKEVQAFNDEIFEEVNNNIDIILNLQTDEKVDGQIKNLQIQFLTQIFKVHYFDQISFLIMNVVPQIIQDENEKLQSRKTHSDIGITSGKLILFVFQLNLTLLFQMYEKMCKIRSSTRYQQVKFNQLKCIKCRF